MIIKEYGKSVADKYIGIEPEYNTFLCETDVYTGPNIQDDFEQLVTHLKKEQKVTEIDNENYTVTCGNNFYTLSKKKTITENGKVVYKSSTIEMQVKETLFTKDLIFINDNNKKEFINDKAYEDLNGRLIQLNVTPHKFVECYKEDADRILADIFTYKVMYGFNISNYIYDVLGDITPNKKVSDKLINLINKLVDIEQNQDKRGNITILQIITQFRELNRYLLKDCKFVLQPKHENK